MKRLINILSMIVLLATLLVACDKSTPPPSLSKAETTPVPAAPITGLPAGTDGKSWWNDTVFYEIFVRSFYDSNGDGIGDFNGIIAKLDYLKDLGITGIWLMPIFPSPSYHGYDVTDYLAVNPQYGTMDDFKKLLDEAHRAGIRIIIDLVLNHSSSEHPWFKEALDANSPKHNWYIWSDTNPGTTGPWGQKVWYPSPSGDGYYFALFWEGMPDLNYNNPEVTAEMEKVTGFWLKDVGVDGFRLDAARHMIEEGKEMADTPATHNWWKRFRTVYKGINPNAFAVGEIWTSDYAVVSYVKNNDELDSAFDFDLAAKVLSGVNERNAGTILGTLKISHKLFQGSAANFLTNHDMNRVMSQLSGSDVWDKARLAATILMTEPGIPFVYYGEETGMTGKKPDEMIRTPMQWTADQYAGFTTGSPWEAVNSDYTERNVAAQLNGPGSLLSLYRKLIQLRNQHAALRVGDYTAVEADNAALMTFLRISKEETVLVIINLSKKPVSKVQLSLIQGTLSGKYLAVPLLGEGAFASLSANAQGGFDNYTPLPELPANSGIILQLQPVK